MASSTDEEEPAPLAAQSAPSDSVEAGRADPSPKRTTWPARKIRIPLIFCVVGVIFTLGALGLYFLATPGQLTAPSFATIEVKSSFPIDELRYGVSPSPTSSSVTDITVWAQLPNNVLTPPAKAAAAVLYFQLPAGVHFVSCPQACESDKTANNAYVWTQPLNFNYEDTFNASDSGEAKATFQVAADSFGYAANGANASAAIPQTFYLGPGSTPMELYAAYENVGAPDAYDWSGLPPESTSASEIIWDEPVPSGASTPGAIDEGANDATQAQDGYKIFLAGALIGLAGGALLAALQEALHANDD